MNDEDKIREELRKTGDKFLESLKSEVDSCVFLGDTDRLHGLVHQVDVYLSYCVIHALKTKGFSKEIRELCDKAGRKRNLGRGGLTR